MSNLSRNEVCPHCGRYANRGVSIDAVIMKDDSVLLVQRGVEPDKGLWGTPGGYVEWDESVEDTVKREVKEETGLTVTNVRLVEVLSKPERHPKQVINILYLVEVDDGQPVADDDVDDVKWFNLNDLPEKMALDHEQSVKRAVKLKG